MSNATDAVRFDFRKQSRLSTAKKENCRVWFDSFVQDFVEKWNQLTSIETKIQFAEQTTVEFDTARDSLRGPSIAKEFTLGPSAIGSILVLDRSIALAMIFGLLGDQMESVPDDRQFSEIELSVGDLLFQKLIDSIGESWPQRDRLPCSLSTSLEMSPHKSRMWGPRQKVFVCSFALQIGETQGQLQWILPLAELEELLQVLDIPHVELSKEAQKQMQQNVGHLPVDISVELGSTNVSVAKLAVLAVGDIVVLQQRISDPLPLLVDNKPKFNGWLGRSGNRQAFKISELK